MRSEENRSHFVLAYGTHHRGGPWWRRWACAWWAAGRPAAVAALVVGLLAYALGPREYTATVTVQLQPPPPPRVVYANGAAAVPLVNALAQRARRGELLDEVLRSPQWARATAAKPRTPLQNPIDAEVIAGTSLVRLSFTDSDRRLACVGADAAAAALAMPAPADVRRIEVLVHYRATIAAEFDAVRQHKLVMPTSRIISLKDREAELAARLEEAGALLAQLPSTPRARPGAPAAVAWPFATNQMELLAAGARAAALALPAAFLIALVWRWLFRRHATTQQRHTAPTDGAPWAADT